MTLNYLMIKKDYNVTNKEYILQIAKKWRKKVPIKCLNFFMFYIDWSTFIKCINTKLRKVLDNFSYLVNSFLLFFILPKTCSILILFLYVL